MDLKHRLAAILAADAAGYSRLMSLDDRATVASLDAARAVFRTQIEAQQGRVIDTAGDSVLAVFGTAGGAVTAALEIQAQINLLAELEPEERCMRFRVGVHLGDVIEKTDGTVYGDGVNIAARLEGLAEPGGVTVSDSIRIAVKGKVEASFEDQGEKQVKNIADPVRAWSLRAPGLRSGAPRALRPAPVTAAVATPTTNLPARPTRLIGRAPETARARNLLGLHRLVTLTAIGGCGKTRLAIAIGEEELPHRPQGVWFTDLTAVMNDADVPRAIASALGLVLTGGDAHGQVIAYLADKAALMILDNCEHLIDACASFAEAFLAVAGQSVILATSREALGVNGEQVMQLATLSAEPRGTGQSESVQLFVERATSIAPDFRLDAGNQAAVKSLCEHLDGLPLAIELAAARITVMTPAELLSGLGDRFAILSGRRRRQHHRTLEATLDWSYKLLDADLQRCYRSLGVFVGGFDVEAVMAVNGLDRPRALDMLEALVAKSLVVRTPSQQAARFGLLETLKAYADERLIQADEAAHMRDRHLEHYHRMAMVHGRADDADVRLGDRMRQDRSNIVSAFDWATKTNRWISAGELLLGTRAMFDIDGNAAEAKALFHRCEARLDAVDANLADYLRCSIVPSLVLVDDWSTVRQISKRLAASDDAHLQAVGYGWLAYMHGTTSPAKAREWRDRSLAALAALAETGQNADQLRSNLMWLLGVTHVHVGDLAAALVSFDQACDMASGQDRVTTIGLGANADAAMCLLLLGDPTKALARIARVDGFPYVLGRIQSVTALAHLALGSVEIARQHIRDHAFEAATGRQSRQCSDTLLLLAQLAHKEGDDRSAVDLLSKLGMCRSPSTNHGARMLARELGVAEQRARDEQECTTLRSFAEHGPLGVRRAMAALNQEIKRRGWA